MNFESPIIPNDRTRNMTPHSINERLDRKTRERVLTIERMGADAAWKRLEQLDREWDIDRALMVLFSTTVFAQLIKAKKNRQWLLGPLIQSPLFFLHSMIGWCPPVSLLRPLGFRTSKEIQAEREAILRYLAH